MRDYFIILSEAFSSNEFKFSELPAINNEYRDKVDTFRQPFTGRPEEVLIQVGGDQGIKHPTDFF